LSSSGFTRSLIKNILRGFLPGSKEAHHECEAIDSELPLFKLTMNDFYVPERKIG